MKMIVAYLQPERTSAVQDALAQSGIVAMTMSAAQGCGQQRGRVGMSGGGLAQPCLLPKTRLEIAVRDDLLDTALDAIVGAARTYHLGDGMVFVYDIADCLRIRTRARGRAALDQKTAAGAYHATGTGNAPGLHAGAND